MMKNDFGFGIYVSLLIIQMCAVFLAIYVGIKLDRFEDRLDEIASNTRPRAEVRIEEDDPRWNCLTMGNRVCGP
jgi:hypothetical protein